MLAAFVLHMRLAHKNKVRKAQLEGMTPDEKAGLPDDTELVDTDPRYIFMT